MSYFHYLFWFQVDVWHQIGGGVLGDVWHPEQRGKAIAIYSLAPLLGPVLGPVCGAWCAPFSSLPFTSCFLNVCQDRGTVDVALGRKSIFFLHA
jgi:MFS family permease